MAKGPDKPNSASGHTLILLTTLLLNLANETVIDMYVLKYLAFVGVPDGRAQVWARPGRWTVATHGQL